MRPFLALSLALVLGCSTTDPGPPADTGPADTLADTGAALDTSTPPPRCEPGRVLACGAGTGCVQTCDGAGAWGLCTCPDAGSDTGAPADTGLDTGSALDSSAPADTGVLVDSGRDTGSAPTDTGRADTGDPCDRDHDGFRAASCGGNDCNDELAAVHPGAAESCDGTDENCDGNADWLATPDGGVFFDPAASAWCSTRLPRQAAEYNLVAPACVPPNRTIATCAPIDLMWPRCVGCYRPSRTGTCDVLWPAVPGRVEASTSCTY